MVLEIRPQSHRRLDGWGQPPTPTTRLAHYVDTVAYQRRPACFIPTGLGLPIRERHDERSHHRTVTLRGDHHSTAA
jgi:hypothetical protein